MEGYISSICLQSHAISEFLNCSKIQIWYIFSINDSEIIRLWTLTAMVGVHYA